MMDINKIEEISLEIDNHLRKLEGFMSVMRDVKISLETLRTAQESKVIYELSSLRRDVSDMANQLRKNGLNLSSDYEKSLNEIRDLIESKDWPEAISPECICGPEDEKSKTERAFSILDILIGEHMKGKKFLDYGCGEGHTIPAALEREAGFALGYDINLDQCKFEKENFTDDFNIVKQNAPYDIILLNDVLDHIMQIDPIEALKEISKIIKPEGKIYVRNHPWCSRHGGHLYQKKNKAFLHLIMDEIEITRCLGLESDHNIKITTPIETYRYWFDESGLTYKNELVMRNDVEDFFKKHSILKERLEKHWENKDTIQNYMEIEFVEYVLKPKEPNKVIF